MEKREKKRDKKVILLIVFILLFLLGFNFFSFFGASLMLPGKELPTISGFDAKTKRWETIDVRSGRVIINVWATWCGACIAEFPEIEKISRQYKLYGLIKNPYKREVLSSLNPAFKNLVVEDAFLDDLYVSFLPTTLLIEDGVVKKARSGTITLETVREWMEE